jgi:16S rRNA (guanine1207-N2)-methyltransferase
VTAVDSDIAAVSTATANAENNRIHNLKVVASHGFDQLDQDQKFDIIVSNPPTHRGRDVLEQMVVESYQHLTASGRLVVVVEARLKPWVARSIKSSFGDYKILKRGPKHVVLTGIKVLQ